MTYEITPVPKPRMTQRDKWKQRPCVMRYREFKDKVREAGIHIAESGCVITFRLPMPKSWSKKKKHMMCHEPHLKRPDVDNLLKSIFDAVFEEDSGVYNIECSKYWDYEGSIEVSNHD